MAKQQPERGILSRLGVQSLASPGSSLGWAHVAGALLLTGCAYLSGTTEPVCAVWSAFDLPGAQSFACNAKVFTVALIITTLAWPIIVLAISQHRSGDHDNSANASPSEDEIENFNTGVLAAQFVVFFVFSILALQHVARLMI